MLLESRTVSATLCFFLPQLLNPGSPGPARDARPWVGSMPTWTRQRLLGTHLRVQLTTEQIPDLTLVAVETRTRLGCRAMLTPPRFSKDFCVRGASPQGQK